jgi:TolB protein
MKMRKMPFIIVITMIFALGDISTQHQAYGSRIAFACFFEELLADICLINPDGSALQNLTNNKASSLFSNWSPDGKKIAYTEHIPLPSRLYQMDADGRNVILLKADRVDFQSRPTYSPDGQKIAFGGFFSITILDINTREERKLLVPKQDSLDAAWSPDGRQIAFAGRDVADGWQWELYVINADGTQLQRLTEHPANDRAPAWSPDGRKLACSAFVGDGHRVGVMNADGSRLKFLAQGHRPAWQPSGLTVNPNGKLSTIWGRVKSSF